MPSQIHLTIGATVVAVLALSSTLLITSYDHDLARAASIIGFTVGTVVGVAVPIYDLLAQRLDHFGQRLTRVETATSRAVEVEQDVLIAVREQARLN